MALWLPEGFDWRNPDYTPVYLRRSEALMRIRKGDVDLKALKQYYAEDRPAQFIHDWGMTFDPRNAERKLPTTVPFLLFERQEQFLTWLKDRWRGREDGLAEKSRDMGMSWLCVGFAVWMLLFQPGTVTGFGSRKVYTLSGGERQRLKLATHLGAAGGVYVLDEPTTGLHLADVAQLLGLLDRLVEAGKSVIVVEHHQSVMAHADWIIDLGPGAGHDGGRIVFEGTPADLVAARDTLTAQHLAAYVGA